MTRYLAPVALMVCAMLASACNQSQAGEPSLVSVPSPPAAAQSAASTSAATAGTTTTTERPAATTTTAAPATTTSVTATTVSDAGSVATSPRPDGAVVVAVERDVAITGGLPVDVWHPSEQGSWPVAVVFHGGGWLSGSRTDMGSFARTLAEGGVVVVNAGYSPLDQGGVFPQMFEEATCAIAAAQSLAGTYSGTGPVTVIGFSAGAHVAAVATFSDGMFDDGCVQPVAPAGAFVGIAGPYDSDEFPFLALQFGGLIADAPEAWARGNPYTYVDGDPRLAVLLLHGDNDVVVNPRFTTGFAATLGAAGYEVDSQMFPGVGHFSIVRMDENGAPTASAALDFIWRQTPG